jgi:hypothetical protein
MSQEIINVLNYLGEQLGIAIDWTSENIWPQVMDILGRYRLMEIIGNCLWIITEVAMAIFAIIVFIKSVKAYMNIKKTHEDNFWWHRSYSGIVWSTGFGTILMIAAGFLGLFSLPFIPMGIGNTLKWLIVPEIKYLEMLKGLMA